MNATQRRLPGAWAQDKVAMTLTLLCARAANSGKPSPVAALALSRLERTV